MAALLAFERGRTRVSKSVPRSLPLASTKRRAASQTSGTSCHSSTRCGVSPMSARLGSTSAAARCAGSSSLETLAERESAVQVLPHHLGPLISTQPNARMRVSRRSSMSRGLYPFWINLFGASIDGYPSPSCDMRNYAVLNTDFTPLSMQFLRHFQCCFYAWRPRRDVRSTT